MTSSAEFPDLKYLEREEKKETMSHPFTHSKLWFQQARDWNGNFKLYLRSRRHYTLG